jgi:uncharacterized protein (DUF488 family)
VTRSSGSNRGVAGTGSFFTIGHSRLTIETFSRLLSDQGITQLVDVRHYPRSRRNPPFNRERLASELSQRGIQYVWEGEALGGLRPGGFRGYMSTPMFAAGMRRLRRLATRAASAIMCAEAEPVCCHRRFIAREMAAAGYRVRHIGTRGKASNDQPLPADTQPT